MASVHYLYSVLGATAVSIGGFAILLPNTVWVDRVKGLVQSYRRCVPVPVPDKMKQLLENVKTDLMYDPSLSSYTLSMEKLNKASLFTMTGFDTYRIGWIHGPYDVALGIPEHFKYDDEEVATAAIKIGERDVDWSSTAGKQLSQSLALSDDAKKFAIARELLLLFHYEVEFKLMNNTVNLLIPFMIIKDLQTRNVLVGKPRPVRYLMYAMVATFSAGLWLLYQDSGTLYREAKVDAVLARLGKDYCKGGLEYYCSILQRNLALRQLLGKKEGPKLITEKGNEQSLFRTKHKPAVDSAEFFEKELEILLDSKKEKVVEATV